MEHLDLLERSAGQIFDFGYQDASDIVAKLNLQYGLGKIIWALKNRGIESEKIFAVTTPDSGITRNAQRWNAGFSYGCLLRWPSKKETGKSFAFPQIKPNACGMLVAKLAKAPVSEDLCHRLHKIEVDGLKVGRSTLNLNVGVSNHFIEICKVTESKGPDLNNGDIVAIIHTSPSEYKSYLYDFDLWQKEGGVLEDTPLGNLLVLEDEVAEKYITRYRQVEEYSKQKRLLLAENLFKQFELISNPTHQGLFGDNEARLGLYNFTDNNEMLPVTFRWDIHVYLMKPEMNLAEEFIPNGKSSEYTKKALRNLNLLPHGGGYEIPFVPDGWRVMQNGSKRLFANKNGANEFIFSAPSEIPYYYRGLQIINEISKLKLAKVAAKLKQIYTLKY